MTNARFAVVALLVAGAPWISVRAQPAAAGASAQAAPRPGAAEYAAHCANCHGAQLGGGVHAPALIGAQFQGNWAGKRARLLYSRIISTMPQNDPGTLSVQQALAVTLYVFTLNGIQWSGHTLSSPDDLNALTIPAGSPSSSPAAGSAK
jgi:S-disulfanyl-L-cysteine oxidoreductase SoxD